MRKQLERLASKATVAAQRPGALVAKNVPQAQPAAAWQVASSALAAAHAGTGSIRVSYPAAPCMSSM